MLEKVNIEYQQGKPEFGRVMILKRFSYLYKKETFSTLVNHLKSIKYQSQRVQSVNLENWRTKIHARLYELKASTSLELLLKTQEEETKRTFKV